MTRIVMWDLEFYAGPRFSADDPGHIMCGAWKDLGGKPSMLTLRDTKPYKKWKRDDSDLVEKLSKELSKADVWVTWNGRQCDVPFLNTRLLRWEMPVLPPVPHVDLFLTSKYQLKMSSWSQKAASKLFGGEQKMPVNFATWIDAIAGDQKAWDIIEKRCLSDIKGLEDNYRRMRPLVKGHPNVILSNIEAGLACPRCASIHVQHRGYRDGATGRAPRYQCQKCGSWFAGKNKKLTDYRNV